MNRHFLENQITYDGSQLQSHWILKTTGLKGDAIVCFQGPCRVDLEHMVDLEDVIQKKSIYSESMLHFIVEHFDLDLEKMILKQRLLMSLIQEELADSISDARIIRRGDDLFIEHNKLTVSIATLSPISSLIHAGINISSHNTPVSTLGLDDFSLNPQAFGFSVMNRFAAEMDGVRWARSKVRGVS